MHVSEAMAEEHAVCLDDLTTQTDTIPLRSRLGVTSRVSCILSLAVSCLMGGCALPCAAEVAAAGGRARGREVSYQLFADSMWRRITNKAQRNTLKAALVYQGGWECK